MVNDEMFSISNWSKGEWIDLAVKYLSFWVLSIFVKQFHTSIYCIEDMACRSSKDYMLVRA